MEIDKRKIWKAKDDRVAKVGFNAYWHKGFDDGLSFALEQIKQVENLALASVSKKLDGEVQEQLNEFSKTQGTKKPKKKRF